MAKRVYVGNLNYTTTESELEALFGEYGSVVSVDIISDKYTERSKGFGFVEMEDDGAADSAISALNGRELGGRELRVNVARERK